MGMQDKERGAQKRSVYLILEASSTGVTQSCAASVEFEDRLMPKVLIKPMYNILTSIFFTELHKASARD